MFKKSDYKGRGKSWEKKREKKEEKLERKWITNPREKEDLWKVKYVRKEGNQRKKKYMDEKKKRLERKGKGGNKEDMKRCMQQRRPINWNFRWKERKKEKREAGKKQERIKIKKIWRGMSNGEEEKNHKLNF